MLVLLLIASLYLLASLLALSNRREILILQNKHLSEPLSWRHQQQHVFRQATSLIFALVFLIFKVRRADKICMIYMVPLPGLKFYQTMNLCAVKNYTSSEFCGYAAGTLGSTFVLFLFNLQNNPSAIATPGPRGSSLNKHLLVQPHIQIPTKARRNGMKRNQPEN